MTGIIILAAGQSTRMGTAKQQLHFKETDLLNHAITTALASDASLVLVVLGYESDRLKPPVVHSRLSFVVNDHWQQGMGSSVRTGIQKLLEAAPTVEEAIIMLCDQPLVTSDLLNTLIHTKASTPYGLVACTYGDTIGVPALFDRAYFGDLLSLQGEAGAKKILLQSQHDVAPVAFPGGIVDIDTPEDFRELQASEDVQP